MAKAAAQKCVLEYVSVSMREIICLEQVGHVNLIGCGAGFKNLLFY